MSHFSRRLFLSASLALAAAFQPAVSFAEDWPTQPIKFIVPFSAGGGTDLVTRQVAAALADKLKSPVLVENREGGAGAIGANFVRRSPNNGYTFLIGTVSSVSASPISIRNMDYDPIEDFEPVTQIVQSYYVLLTHNNMPNDWPALSARFKAEPGKYIHASPGVASVNHIAGELLAKQAGVNVRTVQYNGGTPALTDLMAEQVQLYFNSIGQAKSYVDGGKLKPVMILAPERVQQFPNVPTSKELGFEKIDQLTFWISLQAPKGTPKEITQKMTAAIKEVLAQPDLKEKLMASGMFPAGSTADEFKALALRDKKLYEEAAAVAGLTK